MNSEQLDLFPLEVAALPWGGQSPRALAREVVEERVKRFVAMGTCDVDNSNVRCPSREAHDVFTDAAQFQLCVSTSFR